LSWSHDLQAQLRASFAQWVRIPTTYNIGLSLNSFGTKFSGCYKPQKKFKKKKNQPTNQPKTKTKEYGPKI